MLHGKHIQNGNKTLIIVFQNAAKPLNDAIPAIYADMMAQHEVAKLHARYTWMKFATNFPEADYLFIQDHFSKCYGWYFIDGGKFVHEALNQELTSLIQKYQYEKVIAFGSSKGGTGALLYGLINPLITHVFSLVPQIYVADYLQVLCPNEKHLFLGSDPHFSEQVNQFFFKEAITNRKSKAAIYLYTGTNDIQYVPLVKYHQFLKEHGVDSHLVVNDAEDRHTQLVNQYTAFIYNVLKNMTRSKQYAGEKQLIEVDRHTYLLRGKQVIKS